MSLICSCGRAEVEFGCELCAYCRDDYEQRLYYREMEHRFYADQEAQYVEWLNAQAAESEDSE